MPMPLSATEQLQNVSREILSSSQFFQAFSPEDLELIIPFCQIKFYKKGDMIIEQGETDSHQVFFMLLGQVSVYVEEKYILSLKRPWDIFGEMSIISSTPRTASVIADELVQVLCIDASIIHDPEQEKNYQFKYYFYNMFASIMSWKLKATSDRAKLYEDELLRTQESEKYSQGLEKKLQENLQQTLLYSHAVNGTSEGIIIMDLDGVISMSNPATNRLLDMEESHILGRNFEKFIDTSASGEKTFSNMLKTGITDEGWNGEVELLSKGHTFPAHLSLSPVNNHQGERIALSCIIRDISEQKAYENQILQQKQELEEAYLQLKELDSLKNDFLTLMSHEFRTPLTSILGYSEILTTPEFLDEGDQESYIASIHGEAKRLDKLLANVLNLAKLESGTLFFSFTMGDICQVAEDVIKSYEPSATEKGLSLKWDLPTASEPFCFDEERIREVIAHILDNAIRFTDEGEVIVGMRHEADQTTLWIKDTGVGIAPENYEKVFKKFELIEDMTYHHRGLGIGMPLSYHIIENHQGCIWIESELGQGSTFYFNLSHHLNASSDSSDWGDDEEDFSHLL